MMLVFDLETTGLPYHPLAKLKDQPRIIEYGGVLLNRRGEVTMEDSILINPEISLPLEIVKITGLTDTDLAEALLFEAALPRIKTQFKDANVMVSHNLPFDKGILKYGLARCNISDFPWPQRELCTVQQYAPLWGRNPRLVELYEQVIGKPLKQTHRALDDVRALVEIIIKEQLFKI